MSGIAGIYHLDGCPVDPLLLTRMTGSMAHRGPDGIGHWIEGPVGFGHCMLASTPEALHERQPLTDEAGNLCLTLDGRVDNREELRSGLQSRGHVLRDDTDAELVLRAYQCWAEECPAKILGDFAFAIWDGRRQRLFCARDALGIRTFYYFAGSSCFLCASELRALLEHPGVPRRVNEGMVAEHLAFRISSVDETLYQDIRRLPPAHSLIVEPGGVRTTRYWHIDPGYEVHYRQDADYAAHLRELFDEAVRCRLRATGPLGCELSGGLDSSSVVGTVQALYQSGRATCDGGFETFSLVFDELDCDERRYGEDVIAMWGLQGHCIPADHAAQTDYASIAERYWDVPDYPNFLMVAPLLAAARERGCKVLLTGQGGDHWLTSSDRYYADLLRRLKLVTFLSEARRGRGVVGALRRGVMPLLPRPAAQAARWLFRRPSVSQGTTTFRPWIEPDFARRVDLAGRVAKESAPSSGHALAYHIATVESGMEAHFLEMQARMVATFGLEARQPFRDRRLVEFVVALPEEQRRRGGLQKFVLRQAMHDRLPPRVRERTTKAEFSPVILQGLASLGGEGFLDRLAVADIGWIDGGCFRAMYRELLARYRAGEPHVPSTWPLWSVVGVELWFRAADRRVTQSSRKETIV